MFKGFTPNGASSSKKTINLGFRSIILTSCVVVGLASPIAQADFPDKTIKIIAHTQSGSSTDIFARQLARAAEPVFGQPVVVENHPGGSGAKQMATIMSEPADGYTVGVNTLTHLTAMQTNLKGVYSQEDFSWITLNQLDPYVVAVADDSPYENLQDLMEASEPGDPIDVGGYGTVGSAHNIAFSALADKANAPFNWLGYGGGSQAMTAVLGGHIDAVNTNPGPVLQFAEAGRVRVLGVLNEERLESFPNVPIYSELGYDVDPSWQQIRGIYGRSDIPMEIQEKLANGLFKAMENPEFQKYMTESSLIAGDLGPHEYPQFINNQGNIASKWLDRLTDNK